MEDAAAAVTAARAASTLLNLPLTASAAAVAYLHAWHARAVGGECEAPPPPGRAAAVALLLACKACAPSPLRCCDAVNAAAVVTAGVGAWKNAAEAAGLALPEGGGGGLPPPPVTGKAYTTAKLALLADETALLAALRYEPVPPTPPPHARVLNVCRLVRVPRPVARAAAVLANDVCVLLPAADIAVVSAACVEAASRLTGIKVDADPGWRAAVGGDEAAVAEAAATLCAAVQAAWAARQGGVDG